MKLKQRTIYYQDELHDEFAGDHIKAKHIGQDYRYIRVRPLERMLHGQTENRKFLLHRIAE